MDISNIRNKRKNDDDDSSLRNMKVTKKVENSQTRGVFNLNDVPEGIYPIGDNVFLTRHVYRKKSIVHIRRFKVFGQTCYPTKEGITLDMHQFDVLFRSTISRNSDELLTLNDHLGFTLDLSLEGDNDIKLMKYYYPPNGQETTTSIVLSHDQCGQIRNLHDSIMELLINDWLSGVDFKNIYVTWRNFREGPNYELQESIPDSWDVTLAIKHLTNVLQTVIMDLLLEKGRIQIPERGVGAILSTNDIRDFNTAVKDMNIHSVVKNFYSEIADKNVSQDFLLRKVTDYVTLDFLDSVHLPYIISNVRDKLCPPVGMTCL